jgi:hypothetical protein
MLMERSVTIKKRTTAEEIQSDLKERIEGAQIAMAIAGDAEHPFHRRHDQRKREVQIGL